MKIYIRPQDDSEEDKIECSGIESSKSSDAALLKSLDEAYEESLKNGFYSFDEMMELLRGLGADV